jgi:hypothetical protein
LGEFKDAVIVQPPAPPLAVLLHPDGTFASGREQVLPSGQFLAARVLSDEEQRHQQVYRQLFDPAQAPGTPQTPLLLGWSPPLACGLVWPADARVAGSTFAAIPLRLNRTESGQPFDVPATFIRIESAAGKSGQSMTFNPRTGKWADEADKASQTRLRFVLPPEVVPCQLRQATLTIKLNAPSRKLLIYAVSGGQELLVQQIPNPNRVYAISIDNPEHLRLDDQGGILFTIAISESDQDQPLADRFVSEDEPRTEGDSLAAPMKGKRLELRQSFTTWRIDYVRCDVSGIAN